jgi:predicted dehydrogenase
MDDDRWDVVGFVDIDSAVLTALKNEQHVPSEKIFNDPIVALDTLRPDAVTCSIPNPARLPLVLKAIRRGIDVLVDKPIVHTVDGLKELLGAYAHSSSIVSVAENYRLFPQSQFIAEKVRKGEMGKLGNIYVRFAKQTRFMGSKFYGRLPGWKAVGLEDVVHYVDLFRFFSRANPSTVFSWGWRHPWNWGVGYTAIQASLKMDNDVHAGYIGTWDPSVNLTPWEGEWLFELEKGSFVWNRIEGRVEIYDAYGEKTADYSPDGQHSPQRPPDILNAHSEDSIDYVSEVSMDAVFESFTSAALNGGIVHCPLEDNAYTMSATLALEESAETAKTVNCKEFMESNGVTDLLRKLDRG